MKTRVFMLLLLTPLPIGCGQAADQFERGQQALSSESTAAKDEASNELYLDDVDDSAAADVDEGQAIDPSVEDDITGRRLLQMATKLIKELDTDASNSLSLEEFLAGPEKRAEDVKCSAESKEKMLAKMTEDFTKYAGSDELLSSSELQTLLKEAAPRVGRHRHLKFPGVHVKRVKQTWAEIVAKFDADGDGLLSETEYAAIEKAREQDMEKRRVQMGPPRGPGRRVGPPDHQFGPPPYFGPKDRVETN